MLFFTPRADTEEAGGRKPRRAAAAAAGSLKEHSLGGYISLILFIIIPGNMCAMEIDAS